MKYWLLKSEPKVWAIADQKKVGPKGATWDGVRNYQAANNLKKMSKGDLCFFYHSNIGKEIVGIVEVIKEAYPDTTDKSGRFVAITVKFVKKIRSMLVDLCDEENYQSMFPPIEFCGDNAAMIAMVGLEKFKLKQFDNLDHPAKPRWPLDENAAFLKGAGVQL